jgi:hypothetical protein
MSQFLSIDDATLQGMTVTKLREEARKRYMSYSNKNKATLMHEIVDYDVRMVAYRAEGMRREAEAKVREEAHRATRIFTLRQQENPDPMWIEYPFSYLTAYAVEPKPIPGQPAEEIGDFPYNIAHYYWIHEGQNDEEPWLTLCRLKNGVYVFYKGECDYTGFDCQGSMELYASKNHAVLIQMAMSESDYTKYIADTSA